MITRLALRRRPGVRIAPCWARASLASLLVVLLVVLAACSGASPGTGGGSTPAGGATTTPTEAAPAGGGPGASDAVGQAKPDPCTLLTPDEVKAAIGADVDKGQLDPISSQPGGLTSFFKAYCTWTPLKRDTIFRNVTVVIHGKGADVVQAYDSTRSAANAAPLPGVGDDAYILHGSQAGDNYAVQMKKDPWYIEINVSGADLVPTDAQLTELAKAVAGRL